MAIQTASPLSTKRCTKCGKDVNGQRRMKDQKGNYWCEACGRADEIAKGSDTLVQPCPLCKRPIHAKNLVRNKKSGVYTCDECATSGKASKAEKAEPGGTSKKKLQLIAVAAMMSAAGAIYWYMNQPSGL